MRVVHVAAGNLFGGIERMLVTLAAVPRDDGAQEIALSFDGRLAGELRAAGCSPHILGDTRFSRPLTVWRARRALQRVLLASRPDAT